MNRYNQMNQVPDIFMPPGVFVSLIPSNSEIVRRASYSVLRNREDNAQVYVFRGEDLDEVVTIVDESLEELRRVDPSSPDFDGFKADSLTFYKGVLDGMKNGLAEVRAAQVERPELD